MRPCLTASLHDRYQAQAFTMDSTISINPSSAISPPVGPESRITFSMSGRRSAGHE